MKLLPILLAVLAVGGAFYVGYNNQSVSVSDKQAVSQAIQRQTGQLDENGSIYR